MAGNPISVKIDTVGLAKKMGALMSELPNDVRNALNNVAFATIPVLKHAIETSFDRPTRFAINAPRVFKARAGDDSVEVFLKDPPGFHGKHFLLPEVEGGKREEKGFEFRLGNAATRYVPSSAAPLDAFGNVQRKVYQAVLAQVGAHRDPLQNETDESRAKRKRKKSRGGFGIGAFFRVRAGDGNRGKLKPGIYERTETAFGSAVKPIFVEARSVTYKPRLDFYGIVQREFQARYPNELARQIGITLSKKGGQ